MIKLLRTILSNRVFIFIVLFITFNLYFKNIMLALIFTVTIIIVLHFSKFFCIVEPFDTEDFKTESMFKTKAERNAFCRTMAKANDKCLALEENHQEKSLCNDYNNSLRNTNKLLNRLLGKVYN